MKLYHIILSLLFITTSCVSDDTIEDNAVNSQDFTLEKELNDSNRAPQNPSEILHVSLQYLSYIAARAIYKDLTVEREVHHYLETSQGNTISTDALFSNDSPVPLLTTKIIEFLQFCGYPDINYHRPGIGFDGGGRFYDGNVPWICNDSYVESMLYQELVVNTSTELFFPNRLDHIRTVKPNLRTISSTSSLNLSLLRENEGYRFCPNDLAAYYFEMEYQYEEVVFGGIPFRINTANNYLLEEESTVIARVKLINNTGN